MNWDNLTRDERAEYMRLQMSPQGGYDRTGYLPDDCGECGACGQPTLGSGWCSSCYARWHELHTKLVPADTPSLPVSLSQNERGNNAQ